MAAPAPATSPAHARGHPYLLLATAALLWAGNFVIARAVHGRIPPLALAFWRWTAALALLLPLTHRRLRAAWPALRRVWWYVIAVGVLGVGNFNMLVYVGLQDTTATNALLLNSACPAFIVAIAALAGLGRPSPRGVVGIAVSLAGVVTIVSRGAPSELLQLAFNRGDAWVLAGVLSWAAYTVVFPLRAAGLDARALLTASIVVGVAWMSPFYALELARGRHLPVDAVTVGAILYVAVFASLVAYFCWNAGVARIGAHRSGVFMHLMPAFGTALAVLLLGESFRAFQAVGIALVLAGVWLAGSA